MSNSIEIAETKISNSEKLTLIAGLNVLENDCLLYTSDAADDP